MYLYINIALEQLSLLRRYIIIIAIIIISVCKRKIIILYYELESHIVIKIANSTVYRGSSSKTLAN